MTRRLRLAPAVVALALLGLASTLAACGPNQDAVDIALAQVGRHYSYGGSSPGSGFDCSGLTSYAYRSAGVTSIPRTSRDQYAWTDRISRSDLRPGDLVFYSSGGPGGTISHVAMYVGDDTLVHARSTSYPVRTDPLSTYWTSNLVGYGRVPG